MVPQRSQMLLARSPHLLVQCWHGLLETFTSTSWHLLGSSYRCASVSSVPQWLSKYISVLCPLLPVPLLLPVSLPDASCDSGCSMCWTSEHSSPLPLPTCAALLQGVQAKSGVCCCPDTFLSFLLPAPTATKRASFLGRYQALWGRHWCPPLAMLLPDS